MADSVQFLIDIATKLQGADGASSSLATLGDRMRSAGASAAQLEGATASARAALKLTETAASAAAGALAKAEGAYRTNASSASRAADSAAKLGEAVSAAQAKLAKLGDSDGADGAAVSIEKYRDAASKLDALVAKQAAAQARATSLAAALKQDAAALDALRDASAGASSKLEATAASLENLENATRDQAKAEKEHASAAEKMADIAAGSGKIGQLGSAFGKLGGPMGAAGQKAADLYESFEGLEGVMGKGAGAALGVAGAILAVVAVATIAAVKIASLTFDLAKWAVGLADTKRSAGLAAEALEKTSSSMVGIGKTIESVHKSTGLATDQLGGLAKQLRDAKVSAADMPAALKAVALAEAALGAGAAGELVEQLKTGKKSASELAAEMQGKFGGIVARKMISLEGIAGRLKDALAGTFGGLKIEPLLGALAKLVGMLDQSSASGRALKFLFEAFMQPLIDSAVAALPKIERLFLNIGIGALRAYIAMKPLLQAIDKLGSAPQLPGSGGAGLVVGGTSNPTTTASPGPEGGSADGGKALVDALTASHTAAGELDWNSVGSNAAAGMTEGALGGLPGVIAAMEALGTAAIGALKSKLQIQSPSKVFEGLGGYTAEGFAEGVDAGAGDARSALEDMVEPPDARVPGRGGAGMSGITIEKIEISGVPNAEAMIPRLREALLDLLEGELAGATT